MQTVDSVFTAAEKASARQITQSTQISWHKQNVLGNRTFTIGVSSIGGNDIIGINVGAIGSPSNYKYFDESNYVISAGWERAFNMPQGGLSVSLAEVLLDNTSGRFKPNFMGGRSELATAIQPGKPAIINAGFRAGGIDVNIPQFAGIISHLPTVNIRNRTVDIQMQDYMYYFQSKFLQNAVVFTAERTDQVLETLMLQLGMSTSQYVLDTGLNIISVGAFEIGTKFSDAIGKLVEAENGHFYQDESGIFRFENRQHWLSAPYTNVQKLITTSMVLDAQAPDQNHLVNSVEVSGTPREKQQNDLVWQISGYAGGDIPVVINGTDTTIWVSFNDPMLAVDTPVVNGTAGQTSYYVATVNQDGTGGTVSGIRLKSIAIFAQSAKLIFTNSSTTIGYISTLNIYGRAATKSADSVYYQAQIGHSVTAYQEQPLSITNDFIQSQSWAQTYAQMILQDFSNPNNIQQITIRAIPELQLGDLLSWQGHYFRLFDIKTQMDPSQGFVQTLTMIQQNRYSYFRIGVSTIGGPDLIAA